MAPALVWLFAAGLIFVCAFLFVAPQLLLAAPGD
jgi:hypothetical protein